MELLFNIEALALRWGVSESFVRDRIRKEPLIRFLRLGSRRGIRFRQADVEAFEASRTQGTKT
jgi:hypothetical protein